LTAAGTDVVIDTADVVLMRSDPLDVPTALRIGCGTVRKMQQNLAWAVGYNAIALPIAAGVFEPAFGLMLRPEIAAHARALAVDHHRCATSMTTRDPTPGPARLNTRNGSRARTPSPKSV
jgi:hypothetical protein